MSLQVWMPLNGNLINYGTSSLKFSILSPAATILNGDGKIGYCYTNSSNVAGGIVSDSVIDLGSKQSMFCWMNFASLMSTSGLGGAMVTQHRYSNNTGMGLTMKYVSSSTGYLSINTGNGSSRTYNTYCATTLMQAGIWYHVGYTYDGSEIKLYVNGVCEKTVAFTGMSVPADYIALFTWSMSGTSTESNGIHPNYLLNGKLNDVRVYDHCLSPQEVRELSRGLIVHYPLNSPEITSSKYPNDVTWNQLIPNGDFSNGTTGWNYSMGTISESNQIITITKTGTTSGGFLYQVKTRTNHIYYFKGTMRLVEDPGNDSTKYISLGFCNTQSQGNNPMITIRSSEWTTVSGVGTPDTSTSTLWFCFRVGYSASPVGLQGQAKYAMLIDLTQMFGAGNEPTKEECDMLFYADYYPYDTGSTKNILKNIQDCSGYNHNAVPVNTVTLVNESPKYDKHAQFSTTSYIKCTSPTPEVRSASFWLKIPSIPSSNHVVFVDKKSGLGFGLNSSGCLCSVQAVDTTYKVKTAITVNEWHHITVINTGVAGTGTTRTLYVDGIEQANASSSSYWTHSVDELQIGKRSYNSTQPSGINTEISDFRLYVTALTQEDVLDLYHTSAMIDNLGSIHTFDFVEDNVNSQEIYDTGIFKTKHFIESNDNLLIDTDGSVFLKILHHNNPASNLFTQNNNWLNNDPDLFSNLIILKDSPIFSQLSEYEFIGKEKLTTSSTEVTYRWKQTNNPALTSSATGFQLLSGSAAKLTNGLANAGTHGCFDISGDNWWCCCGAYDAYQGGIPGFTNVVTTGYTDLYIKIPDTLLKGYIDETAKFYTDSAYSKQFLEI